MDWDQVRMVLGRALRHRLAEDADSLLREIEAAALRPSEEETRTHPAPRIDAALLAEVDATVLDAFPERGAQIVRRVHQALGQHLDFRDDRVREEKALFRSDLWLEVCPSLTLVRPRIVDGPGRFLLEKVRTYLGRSRQCDIVLPSNAVSRVHMEFSTSDEGEVSLCDLGSRNGTFLMRPSASKGGRTAVVVERLTDVPLQHGDCIGTGDLVLYFAYPQQPD